jgi:hypothetical protein
LRVGCDKVILQKWSVVSGQFGAHLWEVCLIGR